MSAATMTQAYLTCALWASTGEDGEPLDATFGVDDFAPEAVQAAERDVLAFCIYAAPLLATIGMEANQAGHDLWLTRNHHGAGFWDRGIGEEYDRLTEIAHRLGETDPYVGDDGKVYLA